MSDRASIQINQDDIRRIKRDFLLMEGEVPLATSRAINRALSAVNTEASVQVRKYYKLTSKRVKKNFSTRRSTKVRPAGSWVSRGRPVGLMQFGARQNKRGVSVKVMTDAKRQTVAGAFIQTPGGAAAKTGPQVFWRQKIGGELVDRYDIHRLEGPRIEDALAKPEVQKKLQVVADDTLQKRLDAEANYILSKAR